MRLISATPPGAKARKMPMVGRPVKGCSSTANSRPEATRMMVLPNEATRVRVTRPRVTPAKRQPMVVPTTTCAAFTSRSEEHTSELQSLMRISYAVFCLKKKKTNKHRELKKTQMTNNKHRTQHEETQ